MRISFLLLLTPTLFAQPVRTVWIPAPQSSTAIAAIRPNVHRVTTAANAIIVESAGLSLAYLGPLAADPNPGQNIRQFTFRIPTNPQPATGPHAHIPASHGGVFVNGTPIYNQFESASYRDQNLWHFDPIARPNPAGLLERLTPNTGRHSPIIGYALDGYPVYGPWSHTGRMRSSYRLRPITTRDRWPDGTLLTPGQAGPPVTPEHPLGTFVEDYECIEGAGDLDRYNGRFGPTPEYPNGTYAYFLATNNDGQLAFPYLLAHEFYGQFNPPTREHNLQFPGLPRHLEFVHERPLHVLVISHDLTTFAHIHPEVDEHGLWQANHVFSKPGRYRVYSDFTVPGRPRTVEHFDINITGPTTRQPPPNNPGVILETTQIRAGEDIELQFRATKAIPNWQPYLGAWAHAIIVGEGLSSFLHAHPIEQSGEHTHAQGPPPQQIKVAAMFPNPGCYKLWFQLQSAGKVETIPFELQVAPARPQKPSSRNIPKNAIHIQINEQGFQPASIEIPANRPIPLALHRSAAPNCGRRIVFPALGITRELKPGATTILELPAQSPGSLSFTCGMGMYRGSIVAR